MKLLAKGFVLLGMGVVFAGCATQNDEVYVPKVPAVAKAKLLDYYKQPGEKVFLIAVDPSGECAVGYAYGKATLREAAEEATLNCDAARHEAGVLARPYLYAKNNTVVYEQAITNAKKRAASSVKKAPVAKKKAAPAEKKKAAPVAKETTK